MRAFYKVFGGRVLCGWFKFFLFLKKEINYQCKPTVGRSFLLKNNEHFKVCNICQKRRYWKYFPKKIILNNVSNAFVKISFSLLLNRSNWHVSITSLIKSRFYISWRTSIIHDSLFKISVLPKIHSVCISMQQANSALIDAGGGTTLYVHKVESNQNHRSQEKKISRPNFIFLLMSYFQLT